MSIRDFWRTEIQQLKISLLYGCPIPRETLYEIPHALNHMLIAYKYQRDKRKEFEKAIGHIRRAHLDFLKIQLFAIHTSLDEENSERCYNFRRNFLEARLQELCNVGTTHNDTIKVFRNIILSHREILGIIDVEDSEKNDALLSAETSSNYLILTESERTLLWIWAQIEVLLTSIYGQRLYDVVFSMVESYFIKKDLEGSLQRQIGFMKVLFMKKFINMSLNKDITDGLKKIEKWKVIEEIFNEISTGDINSLKDCDEIINQLLVCIDEPFQYALDSLGVSLSTLVEDSG